MLKTIRFVSASALVAYLMVTVSLVLGPDPELGSRGVTKVVELADGFGITASATVTEFGLNAVLIVPLALLGGLAFPRVRPMAWAAGTFVGSLAVEVTQLLGSPESTGSSRDVVANTLGALVGAALLIVVLDMVTNQRRERQGETRADDLPWSRLSSPTWRALLIGAYAAYLMAVVYLVWTPNPGAPGRTVLRVVDLADQFGLEISSSTAERGLNVLMLVPFSLIGGLLIRRLSISDWVVAGFVLSGTVEIVQRLVLPTRSGSARDIVANTLGALIGALIIAAVLTLWAQVSRRGQAPTRDGPPQGPRSSLADAGPMLR